MKNIANSSSPYLVIRNTINNQYSPAITTKIVNIYSVNGSDVFLVASNSRTPFSAAVGKYISGLENPCVSLLQCLLAWNKNNPAFPHSLDMFGETTKSGVTWSMSIILNAWMK